MHFVVCGLGQVGYRIVSLLRNLGHETTIITQGTRDSWSKELATCGIKIHIGDSRQDSLLREAGLLTCDALLVATSDDAVNIQIALHARRLNPNIRVIVRTFDTTLGLQIRHQLGIEEVVAIPEVAGPVLAAHAMFDQVLARYTTETGRHQLRRSGGNWVNEPLEELLPPRKIPLSRRQEFWKLVTPKALFLWHKRLWRATSPQLRAVFLAINIFIVFAVLGVRLGLSLSAVDAFYFVVTTITTTGFGDISVLNSPDWVKLFVCFLMLMGSAGIAVIYSIVTDYIVTARLSETMQQVPVPDADHVVVAGLGDIGIQIIRELRRDGLEVVVIEKQSTGSHLEAIKADTRVLFGEGRDPEVLSRANLAKAKALIVATGDDGINLGIGLAARSQFPNLRVVLRIFDSDLLQALNANKVFTNALSPSYLAACEFVAIALDSGSKAGFTTDNSFWTVSSEAEVREHPFVASNSE